MFLVKKLPLLIMLTAFTSQAYAESELEEKAKALSVLKQYSETVACGTNLEEQESLEPLLKDIYTIERDDLSGATYYVLWQGDVGCLGGSGTTYFYISEIGRDSNAKPFLVKSDNAFGKQFSEEINSRFIESVKKINPNHFIVISSDFSGSDSNNFPSMKYQYVLQRQNWEWKITSKTLLKSSLD